MSLPTLAGLSVFSAGLNRQPARSWLYIGQSAGSNAAGFVVGCSFAKTQQHPTGTTTNATILANAVLNIIAISSPDGEQRESTRRRVQQSGGLPPPRLSGH